MKKKIALLTACLFLISSAAFAAPLTDYKPGNVSIDLMFRSSENTASLTGYGFDEEDVDFDREINWEPSITVGIADKWALQYRNLNAKSDTIDFYVEAPPVYTGNVRGTAKLQASEFNVLYSVTPQVSAFAGYVRAKGTLAGYVQGLGSGSTSHRKNTWQVGVLGTVPLDKKVSAYAVIGAGSKWLHGEIGLSYAFTQNFEFNVDYRYVQAKDIDDNDDIDIDGITKGVGFGLTYKFI